MFFHLKGLQHLVCMHPSNMTNLAGPSNVNASWKKIVGHKAWLELDNSFDPDLGYMVQLQRLNTIEEGVIQVQTGLIQHVVTYDAVFQYPVIGEVVEAVIFKILPSKIVFSFQGLIYGIVRYDQFPMEEDYEFQENIVEGKEGLKTIRVFISAGDTKKNFKVGTPVLVRITQRAFGNSGYKLTGSMKNKFLGVRSERESLSEPGSPASKNASSDYVDDRNASTSIVEPQV